MSDEDHIMLHYFNSAGFARALTLDLDPALHRLLAARIAALTPDLLDYTEYLIVEPGDTEDDVIRAVGFSPLVEPIEGIRFGDPGFHPYWDWLADHGGWFELIVTFGSTFAFILLIRDADGVTPDLRAMCRHHAIARD